MELTENSGLEEIPAVEPHIHNPATTTVPAPSIDLLEPPTVKQPRNQHLKVPDPKNIQLGGRCTQSEADKIKRAMAANRCTDIVRLMLFSISLHSNDVFSSFKTE